MLTFEIEDVFSIIRTFFSTDWLILWLIWLFCTATTQWRTADMDINSVLQDKVRILTGTGTGAQAV